MNPRHRARRLALQALCCLDVQGPRARAAVREFIDESRDGPPVRAAAVELLEAALYARDRADELLSHHARHWDLARLALVDRNILRLAIAELLATATPARVVITEAIQLAKEFSTAESPRFVNGVLDSVAKRLDSLPGQKKHNGRDAEGWETGGEETAAAEEEEEEETD